MSCDSRSAVVANARDGHHARVSTDAQLAIGLDIGGTKIAGGVVDRSGRRFVNEAVNYHDMGLAMRTAANPCFFVCDHDFLKKYGLGMISYFPLAGGLLGGAYKRGVAPEPGSRGAIRPTFKTWDTPRNWDIIWPCGWMKNERPSAIWWRAS